MNKLLYNHIIMIVTDKLLQVFTAFEGYIFSNS